MKIIYGICFGLVCILSILDVVPFSSLGLTLYAFLFIFGFIVGINYYDRRQRKKERQAQQDETTEMMREYLEQKLKEDKENVESTK